MEPDHVDGILAQWARERPDLDASPIGLIGRLHRLGDVLNVELRKVFAEAGLGDGDFDVLVTLRRHGRPHELTPGELGASTMVTSSAVTKRIDRLERSGLVTRTVSQDDARSRRIRLTDEGFDLVDRLMARHIANEQRLVAGLSERDRAQLAAILRRWGQALATDTGSSEDVSTRHRRGGTAATSGEASSLASP
jgi:DNA-binding MarR family transcriptional regulator